MKENGGGIKKYHRPKFLIKKKKRKSWGEILGKIQSLREKEKYK